MSDLISIAFICAGAVLLLFARDNVSRWIQARRESK